MRRSSVAALVCAAVLAMHAGAGARRGGRRDAGALRARHVGVVRGDDRREVAACRPTCSRATAKRSVQTSTTNIGAYLWSAVAAERLGIIGHAELVARADADADDARADGAPRARAASSTTGTTTATAPSSRAGRRPARRWTRSSPPSTTAGSRSACGSSRSACRSSPRARARSTTRWTSASTTCRTQNRILFHYSPAKGTGPCCYDTVVSESRIADYVGIAKGELPRKAYYGRWRTFPDSCQYSFQETRPSGFDRSYDGVTRLRGQLSLRLHADDAELGRLDVRGADAGAVRARGALGAGLVADEPPVHGRRADRPRAQRRAVRHVGLLALEQAARAATAATASTRPAWTRTGCPPTRTARSSTAASRAARTRPAKPDPPASAYTNGVVTPHAAFLGLRYRRAEALADLARIERIPGAYGQLGLRRLGQRRHRLPVARPALARPGDDHGRARQRARRRRAARRVLGRRRRPRRAARARRRGVQRAAARLHDHRHRPATTASPARAGDDVICGLGGNDPILAGGGDDVALRRRRRRPAGAAARAPTRSTAATATTALLGEDGDDVLAGGPGTDRLEGGPGADHAEGGGGGDRCVTDAADDAPGGCQALPS